MIHHQFVLRMSPTKLPGTCSLDADAVVTVRDRVNGQNNISISTAKHALLCLRCAWTELPNQSITLDTWAVIERVVLEQTNER